mmetsp:Transcript_4723/g.20184  ORF Transcript_4723/g.20184 Transcript_4723/m.20184 type:complete len:593 (-) Transcript_4723:2603-4381(-)
MRWRPRAHNAPAAASCCGRFNASPGGACGSAGLCSCGRSSGWRSWEWRCCRWAGREAGPAAPGRTARGDQRNGAGAGAGRNSHGQGTPAPRCALAAARQGPRAGRCRRRSRWTGQSCRRGGDCRRGSRAGSTGAVRGQGESSVSRSRGRGHQPCQGVGCRPHGRRRVCGRPLPSWAPRAPRTGRRGAAASADRAPPAPHHSPSRPLHPGGARLAGAQRPHGQPCAVRAWGGRSARGHAGGLASARPPSHGAGGLGAACGLGRGCHHAGSGGRERGQPGRQSAGSQGCRSRGSPNRACLHHGCLGRSGAGAGHAGDGLAPSNRHLGTGRPVRPDRRPRHAALAAFALRNQRCCGAGRVSKRDTPGGPGGQRARRLEPQHRGLVSLRVHDSPARALRGVEQVGGRQARPAPAGSQGAVRRAPAAVSAVGRDHTLGGADVGRGAATAGRRRLSRPARRASRGFAPRHNARRRRRRCCFGPGSSFQLACPGALSPGCGAPALVAHGRSGCGSVGGRQFSGPLGSELGREPHPRQHSLLAPRVWPVLESSKPSSAVRQNRVVGHRLAAVSGARVARLLVHREQHLRREGLSARAPPV